MNKEKQDKIFSDIIFESDPQKLIHKALEAFSPDKFSEAELEFWKLQYKIKWELEQYGEHKMEPLQLALTNAFTKLGSDQPDLEALRLLVELDGLATRYFLMEKFDFEPMITFLKKKYTL